MSMFAEFQEGILADWAQHDTWKDERDASGSQPWMPFANLGFLWKANTFYLVVCFLLFQLMIRRTEGFQFKKLLLVYNAICVFLAGYVAVGMIYFKLFKNAGSFVCNTPHDPTGSDDSKLMAHLFLVFYLQKFWEFFDTWFFLLRRSFRQVSFLHVYHHVSITVVVGSIVPYDYMGDMFLPILLNAIVHVLMYGHYFVTALGIKSWWRPYLTSLQLIQFVLIATQSMLGVYYGPKCGQHRTPDFARALMVVYMGSMLFLFGKFFVAQYMGPKKGSKGPRLQPFYVFQGTVQASAQGRAMVDLPSSLQSIGKQVAFLSGATIEFTYQLTPLVNSMPDLHVETTVPHDLVPCSFSLAGAHPDGQVSWAITARVAVPSPSPAAAAFRPGNTTPNNRRFSARPASPSKQAEQAVAPRARSRTRAATASQQGSRSNKAVKTRASSPESHEEEVLPKPRRRRSGAPTRNEQAEIEGLASPVRSSTRIAVRRSRFE